MVQQGLNRHSQIVIPPETKYFFSFLGHTRACQRRHLERLRADLQIALPDPARAVSSNAEARLFYEDMASRYAAKFPNKKLIYFGDKTPEHTGHLPRIRQVFPDAKIIFLYRDGRDVALSLTKMPWMGPDLYVNFVVWLYYHRILARTQSARLDNILFVKYEDTVTAPRKEFTRILDFLGLEYEPAVVEQFGNTEGIPPREFAWKNRALQKITTERVGVFRRELDTEKIGILERLGHKALRSLGYPLCGAGDAALSLGFFLRLSWGFSRFIFGLPWHSVINEVFGRSLWCRPDERVAPAAEASPISPTRVAPARIAPVRQRHRSPARLAALES